ncbi:uncharacterized protein [Parasteatoda tepidariorum]|uniref:uncharacterized protein isoform X1 n=1 Tax=Parasteatoda tepidariorum TaxID=114398 RepID=UPI001C718B74|nr:uncharacterized protein LOC107439911 isoform X1 [Parasteatoda tepidariorum]
MARNEEKHYGRLNRLYLSAEKKKYEEAHPARPKLDSLHTVEEIKKWLPSIKRDIDFYLKKSQVTCYSDQHIAECGEKIVKLEREFKAFVRKIKQLSPDATDPIPWTSRGYKRKFNDDPVDVRDKSEFEPIPCPILEQEKPKKNDPPVFFVNMDLMDKPLCFSTNLKENENLKPSVKPLQHECNPSSSESVELSSKEESSIAHASTRRIVNYEYSSDSDCS